MDFQAVLLLLWQKSLLKRVQKLVERCPPLYLNDAPVGKRDVGRKLSVESGGSGGAADGADERRGGGDREHLDERGGGHGGRGEGGADRA